MSREYDKAFGGEWDLGEYLSESAISYPISQMIRESASSAGIDLGNPIRSMMGFILSGFMGTVMASFMGPFGSILGGLFGETLAMAGNYPGDRTAQEREAQKQAIIALRVKAMTTALEVTKAHTSRETWNAISDEIQTSLSLYGNREATMIEILEIADRTFGDSIRRVNSQVYDNYLKVFRVAKRELGI